MGAFLKYSLFIVIVTFQTTLEAINVESNPSRSGQDQGHCTTDDLNHSVLVECDNLKCKEASSKDVWPKNEGEVIHMYSTRAGERFVVDKLPNLDYEEPEHVRLFDINSTLYVQTNVVNDLGSIRGFGTTLDTEKLLAQLEDDSFDSNYGIILKDAFNSPPLGNGFSTLRLPITRSMVSNDSKNFLKLVRKIDSWASEIDTRNAEIEIKLIIDLKSIDDETVLFRSLTDLGEIIQDCKNCWALVLNKGARKNESLRHTLGSLRQFSAINLTDIKQSPNLLQGLGDDDESFGILVKIEFSTAYNVLDDIKKLYAENMLTIGGYRQQIVEYGDWTDARNYAVAILNNLKHGSNGFIEEVFDIDLLEKSGRNQDCSIYNLRPSYSVHYRGPMYYAIGHFSRHLNGGSSKTLKINVSTAPNMFAAQYGAFKVPGRGVVAIVLNDNEHLLPFRLAVDGRIKTFANIKPKSFNTFVIDIKDEP